MLACTLVSGQLPSSSKSTSTALAPSSSARMSSYLARQLSRYSTPAHRGHCEHRAENATHASQQQ